MPEKLYQQYQDPKTRFIADWLWRLLCLVTLAFISYAQLWGDDRYVTKETFSNEITRIVARVIGEEVKPRLTAVELLAADSARHPSAAELSRDYVTRREFNLILTTLERIEAKIER